jgi:hypothetical protein
MPVLDPNRTWHSVRGPTAIIMCVIYNYAMETRAHSAHGEMAWAIGKNLMAQRIPGLHATGDNKRARMPSIATLTLHDRISSSRACFLRTACLKYSPAWIDAAPDHSIVAQAAGAKPGNPVGRDHDYERDQKHHDADHRDGAEIATFVEIEDQHRNHFGLGGEQDDGC